MTRGQRLSAAIALTAVVLLAGRGGALLFSNHEWFAALGAASVWRSHVTSASILYGAALLVGVAFAWINISAVRRSVVALIVPQRIGNVEFGEEIPSSRLRLITAAASVAVACFSLIALPSWTTLALWRSHVAFAEFDPYFNLDLSHFVSWLPLESGVYTWCIVLFAIVAALVVTLYALTPSLSWGREGLRVASYARRHITVLGAILLLLASWGFRLDAFHTLVDGSGPGGAFTRADHLWIVPADVALSVITIGAAVVLLAAGWMGQTTTAFIAVSVVIAGTLGTQLIGPAVAMRIATTADSTSANRAYGETRDSYTARAFPVEPVPPSTKFVTDSTFISRAGTVGVRGALPNVVFPGAHGAATVSDPQHLIVAPRLGHGFTRLMHAWGEQNPRLLKSEIPSRDAFIRVRDLRERVRAVAPIFAQSANIGAVATARGALWIVDLYSVSEMYPVSAARRAGDTRITYKHHAGTAYVSGGTGAIVIVTDSVLDPIGRAWFDAHPGSYLRRRIPSAMTVPPSVPIPSADTQSATARQFRDDVARIYDRMRAALDSGNLTAFGAAFDSLGRVIGDHR